MGKFVVWLLLPLLWACSTNKNVQSLAGEWSVVLDSADAGESRGYHARLGEMFMNLPGTTDDAGIGVPNKLSLKLEKPQLSHLTRKNSYVGVAWYARPFQVPEEWTGKEVWLNLERVIWQSEVWIDGDKVEGACQSLTTPHRYNVTPYLKKGKKQLVVVKIDNRKKYDISAGDMGHAYTNHTQIMWNGVIGDISMEAKERVRVENVMLFPDVEGKKVVAELELVNLSDEALKSDVVMNVVSKKGTKEFSSLSVPVVVEKGVSRMRFDYPMGDDFTCWSEFSPEVYSFRASVGGKENPVCRDFGMRTLARQGRVLTINGKPLFLRGTLECCIFPLTGTPPMSGDGWRKVFSSAREWGLNHLRFHSWCPPLAAFEVADSMGFYLQVEVPAWTLSIGQDPKTIGFMREEAFRIMREYGSHPSFCFWSMGNELQGNMAELTALVEELKAADSRHLYATTSFTFEGGHGDWPEACDDILITQWTKKGWVRGQGVFNQEPPRFDKDYSVAADSIPVPLVTHEIGQYSVYPALEEIKKYTGVLLPLNFMAIREDLKQKGLLEKAESYTRSSGRLAALLYKEEIERALKTEGISGFQLLDLHDFPGQGTALVGLLDAFWDSKGVISAEEFRGFCSPVVPLIRYPKATYYNDEHFKADVEFSNFSDGELKGRKGVWKVCSGDDCLAEGEFPIENLKLGYNQGVAAIDVDLSGVKKASKLRVSVAIEGSDCRNGWNVWVYPAGLTADFGEVRYATDWNEAARLLAAGEKVLFNPDYKAIRGIEGKFVPVFWSPVHFPRQAGTMGVLCDPSHPALADFPTDDHSDWQWWDLNVHSTTMFVDSLRGGRPIVEMIDNFANNRRLASLYEGTVGKGKVVIASFDLRNDLDKRPAARQMLASLLHYMNGGDFNPPALENFDVLGRYVTAVDKGKGRESATSIY